MHMLRTAETPDEYHARLCKATNGTPVMVWKSLKGFAYSAGFGAFGVYAIESGADPLLTTTIVVTASLGAMVGELAEVEIANFATLTFKRWKNGHGTAEEDD